MMGAIDMTNSNYQKGAAFEREFMEIARTRGYYPVRTAGSHSLIDVVLLPQAGGPHRNVVVCQLKRYAKTKPKIEKAFVDLEFDEEGITKWWVSRKDRGLLEIQVVNSLDTAIKKNKEVLTEIFG